ncbi:hypothetical protein NDU88_000925 [Pleurodeles waltl]|uniref:Uncharacterized protein n=1 Tax=Pleurodeles waltl TaxID=8319 RepID=A0AAV7WL06_PLEWA|nr:hypothetical protein NDU88_000925 [Pleurodeles waltl]
MRSDTPPNADAGGNCQSEPINNTASTDAKMLQLIYGTIRELQTETRAESWRARMAIKQLQGAVRKVAKSCVEIEEKLSTTENRISIVEAEVEVLKEQAETHIGKLTDIMWKDYENRQRRNNLRFLGIEEGVEGNDIRTYMIKLLRNAFPELTKWDWETEIQRVHRFPLARRAAIATMGDRFEDDALMLFEVLVEKCSLYKVQFLRYWSVM